MNCHICNGPLSEGESVCPGCRAKEAHPHEDSLWKKHRLALTLVGALCLFGLYKLSHSIVLGSGGSLVSFSNAKITVLDVLPNEDVSEEKFLLFLLENQLDTITVFSRQKPEDALPRIAETKEKAQEVISHLQGQSAIVGDFIPHFQQVVVLADAYHDMLRQIGDIEGSINDKRGNATLETAGEGAITGWLAAKAFDSGNTQGAVVGVLGAVLSAVEKDRSIEREKRTRIESEAASFATKLDQAGADAVVLADRIAEMKSWNRASIGFERDRKTYGREVLSRPGKELPPVLAELINQRPQNPFLQQYRILLDDQLDGDATTSQTCHQWSGQLLVIAKLIPSGTAYDSIRRSCVKRAGEMAYRAAEQEWRGKKLGDSSSEAGVAASCWKTALSISESDPNGDVRWQYGRSLALAGRLTESEAVLEQVKHLKDGSPEYHYLMSRLSSVRGSQDIAMSHFKDAVAKGFEQISEARLCPDLEGLRKTFGDTLNSLLKVKYDWNVTYGILNDDVTIRNQSAFPLTHVTLRPVVTNSNGNFTPKQPLTLERLDPSKSYTWVNCFSVRGGGEKDTRKADLVCDQNEQ